jgi:hypothetical protein
MGAYSDSLFQSGIRRSRTDPEGFLSSSLGGVVLESTKRPWFYLHRVAVGGCVAWVGANVVLDDGPT